MGIVVTLIMMMGLVAYFFGERVFKNNFVKAHSAISGLLLVLGAWNTLWHGMRHLGLFWGNAAIFSGMFMMLTAMLLHINKINHQKGRMANTNKRIAFVRSFIIIGLLLSFALYAITLIRLNLGMSIIHN